MAKDNGLALCIIIIVVVGLFLHYEMGYNFDLFSVGGSIGNHKRHRKWGWHHHYDIYRDMYHYPYISSHEPSIYEKHNQLK